MNEKHFFNTTGESPEFETKKEQKALSQEKQILAHFSAAPFDEFGASDLSRVFPDWPITSIRRALNKLHDPKTAGDSQKIVITGKQSGAYGNPEYIFTFNRLFK